MPIWIRIFIDIFTYKYIDYLFEFVIIVTLYIHRQDYKSYVTILIVFTIITFIFNTTIIVTRDDLQDVLTMVRNTSNPQVDKNLKFISFLVLISGLFPYFFIIQRFIYICVNRYIDIVYGSAIQGFIYIHMNRYMYVHMCLYS
jgi:hypothetical protein